MQIVGEGVDLPRMKKFVVFFSLCVMAQSLSSCNTYIGLGRDVQKLGEGIQRSGYKDRSSDNSNPYGVPAAKNTSQKSTDQ